MEIGVTLTDFFLEFFVQKIWGFIAANVKVFSNKIPTLFVPTKNMLKLNSSFTQYSRLAYVMCNSVL